MIYTEFNALTDTVICKLTEKGNNNLLLCVQYFHLLTKSRRDIHSAISERIYPDCNTDGAPYGGYTAYIRAAKQVSIV